MVVYIVDIDPVETRYTKQWKEHLPKQLEAAGLQPFVISGGEVKGALTPGAFLDFAGTNTYKSQQMITISQLFSNSEVKNGDYFLYTDAWNPTVLQLKYMAQLLGIKIRIGGLWHGGSYDPFDFLGRLMGEETWVKRAEESMFHIYDDNFYATRFHVSLQADNLFYLKSDDGVGELMSRFKSIKVVGWPMEYLDPILTPFVGIPKKNKIIFPHRLAPETQLDIFKDLAQTMPEYEWFVAQEQKLTKDEYHRHLAESKIMFSAKLQETLGIGAYECAVLGTHPFLPARLSYPEMWTSDFLYPSVWTTSWESYVQHKQHVVAEIHRLMSMDTDFLARRAVEEAQSVGLRFFSGQAMYAAIKAHNAT